MGLKNWEFWTLNGLALLALALWVINLALANGVRALQREANANQQFLNESDQINRLNGQLAQALAAVAVESDDPGIRALLNANGISFTFRPDGEPASAQGDE